MDKFVTSIKQNTTKNQDENIKNEQKDNNENKFYLVNIYI